MRAYLCTLFLVYFLLCDQRVQSSPAEAINESGVPNTRSQKDFITGRHQYSFPWRWSLGRLNVSRVWPGMYLPSLESNSTSQECKKDLLFLVDERPDLLARMVDSWGKFPDGVLMGNANTDGIYDQCLSFKYNHQSYDILGKYCSVMYARWSSETEGSERLRRQKEILTNTRMGQAMASGEIYPLLGYLIYGTCMPSSCTEDDLKRTIEDTLEGGYFIFYIDCTTIEDQPEFLAGDIAFITLLVLLFALMLVAAAVDIYTDMTDKQDLRKGPLRYLLVFSLSTNFRKLFHLSEKGAPGTISCIHGMRVLSMCWVVYGHQQGTNILFVSNLTFVMEKTKNLMFQVISNATVSVDSFFFMSGLLVSYGVMRELQRTGKFNIVMFYVHRFLRLTPAIAITCGYVATISRFFPKGPRAGLMDSTTDVCRDYWWQDVLYVNNYLGFDNGDCLGHCWYTAVDTQLFLVAPLLLLPLHFYPGIGQGFLYLVSLAAVLTPAIITVVGDYPPESLMGIPTEETNRYMRYMYVTPWCRAGSWIVGLWTGYVIFKYNQKRFEMKPWQVVAGWTVAVFMALSVVFGMWSYNQFSEPMEYDVMTQFFYGGFHRTVWAMALAWVVFACYTGYGGIVNSFLSYPAWQPLSRLTYSMYLISIVVQQSIMLARKSVTYMTHMEAILETCGSLFVISIAATLMSLSVESPILGLEKLLFRSGPPPRAKEKDDQLPLTDRS